MPIDPNIILSGQQQVKPLTMADLMQMKQMQQQSQMSDMQMDAQKRALAGETTLNEAYKGATGPDGQINYDSLNSALAKGGQGSKIPGIQKQRYDQMEAKAKFQKTLGEVDKSDRDQLLAFTQKLGTHAASASQIPDPAQRWDYWTQALPAMAKEVQPTENDTAFMRQSKQAMIEMMGKEYEGLQQMQSPADLDNLLAKHLNDAKTHADWIKEAEHKQSQAAAKLIADAKLAEPQSPIAKVEADLKAGRISPADAAAMKKKETHIAREGGSSGEGVSLAGNQTPQQFADALIQGRGKWPSGRDLKDPVKNAGWRLALSQDPELNENTFGLRSKAYADSVSGKGGQTLASADTALLHLSNYVNNTGAIPDSGNKWVNKVWQPLREATSNEASDAIGRAATDVTTLADELESAYRNGGGTEHGIAYFRSMLDPSLPESTRRSNAREIAGLLAGKRDETVNRINRAFPKGRGLDLPMSDESKAALANIQGRNGVKANAPAPSSSAKPYSGKQASTAQIKEDGAAHGLDASAALDKWIKGGGKVVD